MKKVTLWSMLVLTVLALPMMTSCGGDDDGGTPSEAQIKQYLEAGEGMWQVTEYDDEEGTENNFYTQFKEGKPRDILINGNHTRLQGTSYILNHLTMAQYTLLK